MSPVSRVSRSGLVGLTVSMMLVALALPTMVPWRAGGAHVAAAAASSAAQRAAIQSNYGRLPLSFELNQGQADPAVRFLAHGGGYTLALTPGEALLALEQPSSSAARPNQFHLPGQPALPAHTSQHQPPSVMGMRWLGANANPMVTGEDALPGTVNYFIGNDPSKWHTNIPTYQQVRMHNVYPGVDLVYYGNAGQLEYDFVVAPGADPARISLGFTGASQVGVDLQGNLRLALPGGVLQQDKPLVYQTVNGTRQPVAGGYTVTNGQRASFTLGSYNPRLPLMIDPSYKFSTYLGGSADDQGFGITVDASGNAYITGETNSTDFPTTLSAVQPRWGGGDAAFVTKLGATGTTLLYSTYLGGSARVSRGNGIAVDSSGDAYVTGFTTDNDFPTTPGAFQTTNIGYEIGYSETGFVSELDATGSTLVFSTYLGGSSGNDQANAIAVDSTGNAYVTGYTASTDFPTAAAFQGTNNNANGGGTAFVTKFSTSGSLLVYSTYLGGTGGDIGYSITLNASGNAYVTGFTSSTDFPTSAGAFQNTLRSSYGNVFVSELATTGTALLFSTYLGGSNGDIDQGFGIVVDSSGDVYVTGEASSTDFPTTPGAFQTTNTLGDDVTAFVTKFNSSGTRLIYSTYLGGSGADYAKGIAVDSSGDAYVSGITDSPDFPTAYSLQAQIGASNAQNAFVTKFNASGSSLLFSTYLGGSSFDAANGIALGANATVYVTGYAQSVDFPTANALYPSFQGGTQDAFVAKIATLPSVDTTTGVFRPSNGALYLKNANTTGPADITLYYGKPGDQPITGDWTGKGYKSIGIYRSGTFYLRNSNTTGYADITVPFGNSTDIPVAGDWTGKGYDSIGVYRPSTNTFLLRNSNTSGPADITARLGISGDVPIVGDWTGKGYDSIGVFRPSNGIVYLRNSNTTGVADINFVYGIAGDKPVVGDWDGNGTDTIGVDRNGNFLLRNSNTTGPANLSFYLGVSGDDPIAGPWLAPASSPPPVHRGPSTPSTHAATIPAWRAAPGKR